MGNLLHFYYGEPAPGGPISRILAHFGGSRGGPPGGPRGGAKFRENFGPENLSRPGPPGRPGAAPPGGPSQEFFSSSKFGEVDHFPSGCTVEKVFCFTAIPCNVDKTMSKFLKFCVIWVDLVIDRGLATVF